MEDAGVPFLRCFSEVDDPRIDRTKKHLLTDIIAIVLCSLLAGINDFEHMEEFARLRESWFRRFLQLPHGIPSHDTLNRVFARVHHTQFEDAFVKWMGEVTRLSGGEIVPIDGKTLRGSFNRAGGNAPIHMVSAWASVNGVVMGQVKVDDKSNEITAIPRLLEILDLKACLVTIDAMGCQRDIAEKIVAAEADYTLALKANQPSLYRDVVAQFCRARNDEDVPTAVTNGKGHGRVEQRQYYLIDDVESLQSAHAWPGLKSIGLVRSTTVTDGGRTVEDRYYINSYSGDVDRFAKAVRSHWLVESNLHWSLDVTFSEDASRVRQGHAAANLSMMRRAALNMLRSDGTKGSLKKKQMRCAVSDQQLDKALFGRAF